MPTTIQQMFGQVLRKMRRRRKLTQEQLALLSGYHPSYISMLERGQKNPSLKAIFHLALPLEVQPSDMILRLESLLNDIPDAHLQGKKARDK